MTAAGTPVSARRVRAYTARRITVRVESARARSTNPRFSRPADEDFAADRVGERDIRSHVEAQPSIGPLRRARAPRIDDVKLRAVAHRAQNVMEEDRMRLARVRAPEHDQVGVRDLLVGARTAACPEYRRQTDDARSVSSSIAAIDVVAADDRASELLRDVVHLVGRLRAAEHAERAGRAARPTSRKPRAARSSASSQDAGRSAPFVRIIG